MNATAEFLTPEEVVQRYRSEVSVGTLRNWRAMRIGPDYVKVGKSVLYPLEKLIQWDRQNTVSCTSSKWPKANPEKTNIRQLNGRGEQHDLL